MAKVYKCKECPFFEKKGGKWYCNKFNTTVDYNKDSCPEMKKG